MIHVKIPFNLNKDMGKAYNDAFKSVCDNDWVCLIDHDVLFLTPDAITLMHEYTHNFPQTGIFTCFTNRIHPNQTDQLLNGKISDNTNIEYHMQLAYNQKRFGFKVTEIKHEISGFLMLISKKTWNEYKFEENMGCLGVDNYYSDRILAAKKKIYRMDSLYVWHTYRLKNGIKDKTHLI